MLGAFCEARLLLRSSDSSQWTTASTIPSELLVPGQCVSGLLDYIRSDLLNVIAVDAESDWILTIPQAKDQGFPIDVTGSIGSRDVTVMFGELEVTFPDMQTALGWVGKALSDSYRLKTKSKAGRMVLCRLEPTDQSLSNEALEMGYGFRWLYIRNATETVRQNGLRLDHV
jgi:hypothetical protein